jgi:hypothetical protein
MPLLQIVKREILQAADEGKTELLGGFLRHSHYVSAELLYLRYDQQIAFFIFCNSSTLKN